MATPKELGGIPFSDHYLDLQRRLTPYIFLEEAVYECISAFEKFGHGLLDHHMSVSRLSTAFAEAISVADSLVDLIRPAALVHDVGKIGLPIALLEKPNHTPEERQMMEKHVDLGIVQAHHRYWNGLGYPANVVMAGTQIPLGARTIAIADHYTAATEDRPDRGALSKNVALDEISKFSGTQYDPELVKAFLTFMNGLNQ